MKKYILILLCSGFVFFGCKKSFLDEIATNQVASDSYFKNYDQANTVLTGVYQQLQQVFMQDRFVVWGIGSTDEVSTPTFGNARRQMHVYNIQTNNDLVLDMWRRLYTGVYRANQVIDRVTKMTPNQISAENQKRLVGEAKFLRGLFYFQLTKIYGEVPLTIKEINKEADIPTTRTAVADVYKQIIEDLQFAKANCRTSLLGGAATKGAATALLGRVYLQMTGWPLNDASKFQPAADELKEVLDNPLYGLAPVYADMFSSTKENNLEILKEIIFTIKFDGPGLGNGGEMGSYMGPSGPDNAGGALNTQYANVSRASYYDSTKDVRFFQNIGFINPVNGVKRPPINWNTGKWLKPQAWQGGVVPSWSYDSPLDFALIRFADVKLMYAEALNAINNGPTQNALDQLNAVNTRSKKPGSTGIPLYTMAMNITKAGFVDTLLKERYRELCFEGLRKDDLIRMDKLFIVLRNLPNERWDTPALGRPGDIQDFQRIWPIPQSEIDVSHIPQNTGY